MQNSVHKLIMMTSVDFIDLYKSIINNGMRQKDYDLMQQHTIEILEAVDWIRKELAQTEKFDHKDVFKQHTDNIEYATKALNPIIAGLKMKAEASGKYGFFQYRKDLKHLNSVYDLFEHSGNYMNTLSSIYT